MPARPGSAAAIGVATLRTAAAGSWTPGRCDCFNYATPAGVKTVRGRRQRRGSRTRLGAETSFDRAGQHDRIASRNDLAAAARLFGKPAGVADDARQAELAGKRHEPAL